ncbi:MAG: RNA-binding S4 domain-containing protein [Ruminococcaceae bacterium]|nr:RNA-binding S4 domain-containing protein [Oscillospiraceae bacterium]
MTSIKISTEFIKLSQFIKFAGITGTGGAAKDIILDGLVQVNGEICLQKGKKLFVGDTVTVTLEQKEEFIIS